MKMLAENINDTVGPHNPLPRFAGYCAELQLLITANRYVCGLFVVTQVTSYILAIWCLNSRVVSLLPVVYSFTQEQSFLSARKRYLLVTHDRNAGI